MESYMAFIYPSAITYAPQYFSYCNGQSITVANNQTMYALLGNIYGGNQTAFNLPDFRGRAIVGSTSMGGNPTPWVANPNNYLLGATGGMEFVTLNATQIAPHTHPVTGAITTGTGNISNLTLNGTGTLAASTANGSSPTPGNGNFPAKGMTGAGDAVSMYGPSNGTNMPVSLSAATTSGTVTLTNLQTSANTSPNNNGAMPHENRMPFIAMNYVICMQGLWPPRP